MDFTALTISTRPLADCPEPILRNAYNGLQNLADKKLCRGNFHIGGCVCVVGSAITQAVSDKDSVSFKSALDSLMTDDNFAETLGCRDMGTLGLEAWHILAHKLNDQFGQGGDSNHPTVQKARYAYVKGVVESEMILRGFLG